jgi:hypothetical protein
VSAGVSGTAIGAAGADMVGGGALRGATSAVKAAMPGAKEAVAKEGAEALRSEGIKQTEKQIAGAGERAAQPPPSVAPAQAAAKQTGEAVAQSRAALANADKTVEGAAADVAKMRRQLQIADKYTDPAKRSASNIRGLRQALAESEKKLADAKAVQGHAKDRLATVTGMNKDATAQLKTATTAAQKAAQRAEASQKIAAKYSTMRNEFQVEKDPAKIARMADSLIKDLRKSDLITDAQHKAYLRQVDDVQAKVKDAETAKKRLQYIAAGALKLALGAEAYHLVKGFVP